MGPLLQKSYHVLCRMEHWDPETSHAITKRIHNESKQQADYIFFSEIEGETLEVLLSVLVPQENRGEPIRISQLIDRELAKNATWPQQFYKRGLLELENFSYSKFRRPIEDLSFEKLEMLILEILGMDPSAFLYRFLRKVLFDASAIYYSHPVSWNKIGSSEHFYPEDYPFPD